MKHVGDSNGTDFAVFMDSYDWKEAMNYAEFKFGDIKEILFTEEGCNDEAPWKLVVLLKNGTYGYLNAGCCYSGWDCQAGGTSGTCSTYEEARLEVDK